MSASDDNQDLQTYFDNFKGEIEESDECVTLTAEALRALSEADAVTEKILEEDAGMNSDDNKAHEMGNIEKKKNIYYLKLSDKESIQVKIIGGINSPTGVENITEQQAAIDDKPNPCQEDENTHREKIYEFDEDEKILNPADDEPQLKVLPGASVMQMVQRENAVATDGVIHQCPQCSYATKKRYLLSRHLHTHSDERPYKCSVCDRAFKLSPALVNHMNSHLGKKPHGCKYCEMRFNTIGELLRHVRYKHTGEKPHKCGECDYCSVELSKMRRHMRCHTGERPYQCPHCTYASPDTFKLKRHLRTHTGEKPYECDICLARFTQSNSLKAHRLIHTVGDRPVFQCKLCPTTCGRKTDLQLHVQKLHNPDHPMKCKRCGKELPDRYSFKVHLKTHEGEKCFRCTICPYASISRRHLNMHMLVHTDEKPFVCELCNCSFRQRQLLVRHNNLHHNEDYVPPPPLEKNHVCPHCDRAFTRKGNMLRHMEKHDSFLNKEEEKLKLKLGRQIRIEPDGSLTLPPNAGINCVIGRPNNNILNQITSGDNDERQGEESFSILEVEDDDNVGSVGDTDEIPYHSLMKHSNTITMQNKSSDPNKFVLMPSNLKQQTVLKHEQVEVKSEQGTVTVDIDDENEHFMVIEVIDDEDAEDGVMSMENSEIHHGILELPMHSSGKRNTENSLDYADVEEYILPVEYKPSQITIMDVMHADG